MASFLDKPTKFNPYIETAPIDSMIAVGGAKQQLYDQGVQKIQGQIDTLSGIPVLNEVSKKYLQGKLDQLKTSISGSLAGDFSNQSLVNSISSLTNNISRDPYIQNAVRSSTNYNTQLAKRDEYEKAGKTSPDNDNHFHNGLSKYLNSTSLDDVFSDQYIPTYDIEADVYKAMAAAHADSADWEEVPKNSDGTLNADLIAQKSKEGLLSSKVANIIGRVFSKPQVAQQLAISGEYTYKDYTPDMLRETQDKTIAYYRDQAAKDREKFKLLNQISDKDGKKANAALLSIEENLLNQEQEYAKTVDLIYKNPEAAKVQLYIENLKSRYIDDLSWEKNSQKLAVSPQFTVAMQRANFNFLQQKEKFDELDANRKFNVELEKLDILKYDAQTKREIAEGKRKADGSLAVTYNRGAIENPAEKDKLGRSSYVANTEALNDKRIQLQAELITSLDGYEDLFIKEGNGVYRMNPKYKDWGEANSKYRQAIIELEKGYQNGTLNPNYQEQTREFYDLTSQVMQNKKIIADTDAKYAVQIAKLEAAIPNLDTNLINTKILSKPLTKTDVVNYIIYKNSKDEAAKNSAEQALTAKFGNASTIGLGKVLTEGINNALSKNPSLLSSFEGRELEYKKMQEQTQNLYGTFNTYTAEDKLAMNGFFQSKLSDIMGDGAKAGDYKTLAGWLSAKEPANLNNNIYTSFKGQDGNWYLQVRRNNGKGFDFSEPLKIDRDVLDQVGMREDPKEAEFESKFGGFLGNFYGNKTTESFTSPIAENTAIMRHQIGKYSVGLHIKALNSGYIEYLYIRDKDGNVLANGLPVDFSVFSKDKRFKHEEQAAFKNMPSVISKQDVIDKFNSFDEHFIDLMLKK